MVLTRNVSTPYCTGVFIRLATFWLVLLFEGQWPRQWRTVNKKDSDQKSKGLVVIPYVEGLSEKASRVFKKHGYATAMKPHTTLRQLLVHPKDKRNPRQTTDIVYEIPCHGCPKSYIGESGRLLDTRLNKHKDEVDKFEAKTYTRALRKSKIGDQHKSAVTDHVAATNHAINWDDTHIIDKEGHKTTRWLKEAIWIRRRGTNTMNKDEGAYKLNSIYDQLISSPPSTGLSCPYKNNRTSQKVASLMKTPVQ